MKIRIAVVGDFKPEVRAHTALNEALGHTSEHLGLAVDVDWVPTPQVSRTNVALVLGSAQGIIVPPNSPYESMEGALAAIEFARTRGWPFYGS
jgi:CTP synthase (UTP-ammonia lyase)